LVDWIVTYVKNRDSVAKKIESIEKDKDGFDVFVKFKGSLKSEISNSRRNSKGISGVPEKPKVFLRTYESSIRKKEQYFIVMPFINNIDDVLTKIKEDMHFGMVTFNTKENFNVVIDNWKKLINFKHLSIYFVNPFSQLDKKWIIYPYTHSKICDEGSLKLGLKTMFEMVEPIDEEKVKTLIK